MLGDFLFIFYWWLLLLLLGVLSAPIVKKLFNQFWDKGYIFTKTITVILLSFLAFIFGRIHLLPFTRGVLILFIFGAIIANWWYKKENSKEFDDFWDNNWKTFLIQEVAFLILISFWTFIRGFQPAIEGLEKFMDLGFVNSILRTKWFPPADMWFAGESINYYYFGHLQAAVLTKLSGLSSAITYNLMLGTLFGLTFMSGFSLVSNLIYLIKQKKKKITKEVIIGGIVAGLLLTLGGNLHTPFYVLKEGPKNYWYPDATRFIGYQPDNPNDATIHEFPSYSFVVADLHGHLNDLPTVLLFMAVLIIWGISLKEKFKDLKEFKFKKLPHEFFVMPFLLAVMYMTNSWDLPIYGILFALVTLFITLTPINKLSFKRLWQGVKTTFIYGTIVLILSIIFALPFALSFQPMTEGIRFVNAHSLWWQLLILYGFFWLISLTFWVFVGIKLRNKKAKDLAVSDFFVLAATFWATILIIIPEIVYVKDIYIAEYHRANTMFKLVYQAFVMYCLSLGYIVIRLKNWLKEKKLVLAIIYLIPFTIGFGAQMIYPYFSIKSYYRELKEYQGIYGYRFLEEQYPGNYQIVRWLNRNVTGQPVILEAVGDSYTLYNHTSALTGLPTIEGWLVHEWLWRGGYDQPGARAEEVDKIYQGESDDRAFELLQNYGVEYVLVGPLERKKYPQIKEERFKDFGKIIYSSHTSRLYQLEI
jgi:uncharacterized membrane protein